MEVHFLTVLFLLPFAGLSCYPGAVGFQSSCLVWTNTFYSWTAGLFPFLLIVCMVHKSIQIKTQGKCFKLWLY